jgi:hypothetical protein
MQEVQTFKRTDVPLTTMRLDWMLGSKRLGVRLLTRRRMAFLPVRETRLPKLGSLPQRSQRIGTVHPQLGLTALGSEALTLSNEARTRSY